MSGVCARCEGTGSVPIDYDPYTNGWTTVECPDCMDPSLPEEPPLMPWEVADEYA